MNIRLSNPLQDAGGARSTRVFMAPRERERERTLLPRKMADESRLRGEGGGLTPCLVCSPRPEEWPGWMEFETRIILVERSFLKTYTQTSLLELL